MQNDKRRPGPAAHQRVPGREGRQLLRQTDRADAGAAAAVRDAEGLVQVEVADVRAHVPRAREADLSDKSHAIAIAHSHTVVRS